MNEQKRLHPKRPRIIVIELDQELELRSGAKGKYADKLIVAGEAVIVVEEASTIRKHDLDQAAETVKKLREGKLNNILARYGANPLRTRPVAIILHGNIDILVENLRTDYTRKLKTPVYTASCSQALQQKLKRILQRPKP